MKTRHGFVLTGIICIAALMFACDSPDISLNEADNNTSVEVKIGNTVAVTLVSNPSTGYSWDGPAIEGAPIIGEAASDFIAGKNRNISGQPGHERFTFAVTGSGKAVLTWKYIRPWETDQPPADIYRITLTTDRIIMK